MRWYSIRTQSGERAVSLQRGTADRALPGLWRNFLAEAIFLAKITEDLFLARGQRWRYFGDRHSGPKGGGTTVRFGGLITSERLFNRVGRTRNRA